MRREYHPLSMRVKFELPAALACSSRSTAHARTIRQLSSAKDITLPLSKHETSLSLLSQRETSIGRCRIARPRAALRPLSALEMAQVRLETTKPAPGNARVTKASSYYAMVYVLSIENADGTLTPSGWSTRKEHKGDGRVLPVAPGRAGPGSRQKPRRSAVSRRGGPRGRRCRCDW